MTRNKWMAATALLAIGLSTGVLAQERRDGDRDRDNRPVYTQRDDRNGDYGRYNRDGDGNYRNGYDRDRDDYRNADGYRRGNYGRDNDHHDRHRDHRRGDRGRDRN